jgi:bifunctional non-homologous end joining protein LigD
LKLDGFRALAVIESGRAELISRNGHPFGSFSDLGRIIAASLPDATNTMIDGEIVCVDSSGRPQFEDLLFHRATPCFFALNLPIRAGKDFRSDRLEDRKLELRRLLAAVPPDAPLKYADHVEGSGIVLYERVCELDLEGMVATLKSGAYVSERESSTWFKVLNRKYSQKVGREKLFERDRRKEPVPGWHSCVVACAELEEAS